MYRVTFTDGARKELHRIDRQWQKQILLAIELLADNPYAKSQVKKLVNSPFYRLRVGQYRVVYDLQRDHLIIQVIHIRKREDAYR